MEDKIFKINLKKYEIYEYVYVIKKYKNNLKVFVMDFQNNTYYLEENYPLEFLKDSHTSQIPKGILYNIYKDKIEEYVKNNYNSVYNDLTSFQEQKTLF